MNSSLMRIPVVLAALAISVYIAGCRKTEIKKEYVYVESTVALAQVKTLPVDSVSFDEAYARVEVVSEGNTPVTECGLCWDEDPQPLRIGAHVGTGEGKGITKGKIEGLKPSTKYYLRSYAVNADGITYGNEIAFTTSTGWTRYASTPNFYAITNMFFDSGVLYGNLSSSLYTSNDLGKTWTSRLQANIVRFSASNNTVYAANMYSSIYFSTNKGVSWTYRSYSGYIYDLVATPSMLFIATDYGIRRSINGGQTWTQANNGIGSSGITALGLNNGVLYASTNSSLYKSTDEGDNWSMVSSAVGGAYDIKGCGANLIASTNGGVYVSKNNGSNWTATGFMTDMNNPRVYCVGKNAVAWSNTSNTCYVSNNEGLTWKKILFDVTERPQSITSDGTTFYASSNLNMYKLSIK